MRDEIKENRTDEVRFANIAPGLLPQGDRAKELRVHPETLARARRRGELAFIRIGDKVYYDRGHIVAWLIRLERPTRKAA